MEQKNGKIWPKHTAGHRMTANVPTASPEQTLADVQASLRANIESLKTINYIYVLDADRKLVGVLSIKDLYRLPGSAVVADVCKRHPLIEMKASTHQQRAASLALQHNIKAIPVTDHNHTFLGSVTSDAILTILQRQQHENRLRKAGIRHPTALATNIFEISIQQSFRHRFPWLLFGLIGGLAAARIIGFFEHTLERNLILASFIPLIVYMADAVGTQMEAYMIRDLSSDNDLPFRKYFARQFAIVLLIAGTFALLLFLTGTLLLGKTALAATLGVSLAGAILSSVCTGLLVPYLFSRFRCDPADASGPIATIIQDILSVVIYFSIATWLL